MDAVESLQMTSSVQHHNYNYTTHPKTVAVQSQVGNSSHRRRVPLELTAGADSATEDAWKSTGDVDHQLQPSTAYCNIVLADFSDDQPGSRADKPLLSRHRRQDVEDSDVLQRLLPSAVTDYHSAVTTSPASLRRRTIRASEHPLLDDDDVTDLRDDVCDVTCGNDVVDDAPWCKVSDTSSVDDNLSLIHI